MQKVAKKNAKKLSIENNAAENDAIENNAFEPLVSNMPSSPSESEFQTLWESEISPSQCIIEFSDDENL